jgi:glycerate dehydrogenase
MVNIVFLDAHTLIADGMSLAPLQKMGNVTYYDRTAPELVIERAKDATIILTNKCVLNADTLHKLPNLKYIGVVATGYNVVDVETARKLNITVTNVRGYSTQAVAQLTFTLMLSLVTGITNYANSSKTDWPLCPDFSYYHHPITELAGKTLGLIGFGDIAQKVAHIALAFGMKVIANRKNIHQPTNLNVTMLSLAAVFEQADFVSLHCPLTQENTGFVNASVLATMKNTAYLINTARGGLLNEQDVANALHNGTIAGAGLDVLSIEPPQPNNPLLTAKNCLITPHQAWASVEARQKLLEGVIENIQAFLKGEPINTV